MKSATTRISVRTLSFIFAIAAAVMIASSAPASILANLVRRANSTVFVEEASGSLWRGHLKGVSAQGVRIGDVAFKTHPLSLLMGRLAADVSVSDGALAGKGEIAIAPDGRLTVSGAKFVFSLDAANRYAILGTPLSGAVRAEIDRLSISKKGCVGGSARLWTDVLIAPAKRFQSEAFDLSGEGQCVGGNFVVALSGQGGEGAVSLSLSVSPTLSYVLSAEAQPSRREVADALQILGFERTNGVLTIGATGIIRSVGS